MHNFTTISSGIYKGKKLKLPSLATTRSTKSIVKGSFFNSLRYEIIDKVFIECFGGSGVMAAEALSNGAKQTFAIEKDRVAFEILKSNLSFSAKNTAIFGDCFLVIDSIISSYNGVILYLDPPFDIRDGFNDIYKKICGLIENLKKDNVFKIIIEHRTDIVFSELIGDFCMYKSKKFGNTTLSFYI